MAWHLVVLVPDRQRNRIEYIQCGIWEFFVVDSHANTRKHTNTHTDRETNMDCFVVSPCFITHTHTPNAGPLCTGGER